MLHVCGVRHREIGASDRSREQNIAAQHDAMSVERDVAGTVTRKMKDVERQIPDAENVAVGEILIGWLRLLERHLVRFGEERLRIVNGPIERMKVHRHARKAATDRGDGADVIQMRVRDPDRTKGRAARFDHIQKLVRIGTGIDDDGIAGLLVDDEIRVLLERADGTRQNLHTAYPPVATIRPTDESRSDARYFSAAIAAVVPSPAAVVTWRVSCDRTSPAANSPSIDV